MPETLSVRSANNLKKGDRIKFYEQDVSIQAVHQNEDWITLMFDRLVFIPQTETWTAHHGCHFGFCFQTIQ